MKKLILTILASMALVCSCQEYDDSVIQERLDTIEQKLTKLEAKVNDNASTISKIVNASYIQSVEKVENGFHITFLDDVDGYLITNGKDGKDGENGKDGDDGKNGATPSVGVKTVNGIVCWTVNGEVLTDAEGKPVPCQTSPAIIPQFKVEEGHWYMTYDGGANWVMIDTGEATTTVLFEETESAFVFIVDGVRFPVSKATGFRLVLKTNDIRISSTDVIEIPYTLTGSDETVHFVFKSDHFVAMADTEKKVIVVTAPGSLDPDVLIIKAIRNSDGAYTAQYVKITGYGEIELVADYFEIGSEGGQVEVPITTDLNFDISFDVDWLSYVTTKAATARNIVVNVAENKKFMDRTGKMTITSVAGDILTVVIKQAMYDDGVTMGVQGRPYELATYADLVEILKNKRIKNSDYPVEFVLTADIDMSGEEWAPLDTKAVYPIHFDGKGHTISNFSQLSAKDAAGFFGYIVGCVENLTFDECSVFANIQNCGIVGSTLGITGWSHTNYAGSYDHSGILKNVHVKNSEVTHVALKSQLGWTGHCGALIGEAFVPGTIISQCSSDKVVVSGDYCCGGLVGQVNYGAVVEKCFAKDVRLNVAEAIPTKGSYNSTWNNNNWVDPYPFDTAGLSLAYTGGIAGIINDGVIRDCYVCGESTVINSGTAERQCAGGIVGCAITNSTVENCWNGAYVTAMMDSPEDNTAIRAGGIVGGTSPWIGGGNTIKNCINWGDIEGTAGGGICAYIGIPTDGYAPNYYGLNYTKDGYNLNGGLGLGSGSFGDPETRTGEIVGSDPHEVGKCFFFHGVKTSDFIGAAKTLGWDSSVWNLSGSQPKLAWEN